MKSNENRFRRKNSKEKGIFDYHPNKEILWYFRWQKVHNIDISNIDYNRFFPTLKINKNFLEKLKKLPAKTSPPAHHY